MTGGRRALAALVLALLAVGAVAPAAVGTAPAQSSSDGGNWTLETLQQGPGTYATVDADAPDGVRLLDDVYGGVALRYQPASPAGSSSYEFMPNGKRIESNTVQVYSTVYGDDAEYSLVVVSWQRGQKQVKTDDGYTTERYAANVSSKRVRVDVGSYETANVSLPGHYASAYQLTMILERNGDPVAVWRGSHKSNPLMKEAPNTDSSGDLLAFGLTNFFLPAVGGAVIARRRGRSDLEDIVVGPMRGTIWWAGLVVGLLVTFGGLLFYQTSVLLVAAPWLSGLTIFAVYYLGYLSFRDHDVLKAEFDQRDLDYVSDPEGDERPAATAAHKVIKRVYEDDNRVYLPKPGLLPMIARKWAAPASLDKNDFETVTDVTGDVDREYAADPAADDVLDVTPAHLAFDPPLLHGARETLRDAFFDQLDRLEAIHWSLAFAGYLPLAAWYKLRRVNWTYVAICVVGFGVGFSAVNAALGLPLIGAVVGLAPGLVASCRARDGTAAFEPAPKHFSDARAVLAVDRAEYETAATFDDLEAQLADDDMMGLEKARELMNAYRTELWEGIDQSLGFDQHGRNDSADDGTDDGAAGAVAGGDDD